MPIISAIELWVGLLGAGIAALLAAISAGRSRRIWQATLLIALEFVGLGAALVLWFFVVWFIAKALMAIGLTATIALLTAIVIGAAALALAVLACVRLVQAGYAAFGMKQRFAEDFSNSLWFGRMGPFRPREFQR